MARNTVFDYNRSKILLRLAHHPALEGCTNHDSDDGESLMVTTPKGVLIKVNDDITWGIVPEAVRTNFKSSGAREVMECLVEASRTVDTEAELEDMVCELYRTKSLEGMDSPRKLLEQAFMWIGLGREDKIGFRKVHGRRVPAALKSKCSCQLDYHLEHDTWDWGSLTWLPLKVLVKLVCSAFYIDAHWKLSIVSCAKDTLFDHYQKHGKLANRYAVELQRRVTALHEVGQWPKVA